MTLRNRLAKLELRHVQEPGVAEIDLPPDLCERILETVNKGTYPHGLCEADLEAIVAAYDQARRWT